MAGAFAIGTDLESSGGKEPTIHTTLVGGSGGSTTVVVRAPYFALVPVATFRGRTGTTPSRVAVPEGFAALTTGAIGVLVVADVEVAGAVCAADFCSEDCCFISCDCDRSSTLAIGPFNTVFEAFGSAAETFFAAKRNATIIPSLPMNRHL